MTKNKTEFNANKTTDIENISSSLCTNLLKIITQRNEPTNNLHKFLQDYHKNEAEQREKWAKLGKQIEEWQSYLRGDFFNALVKNKWFISPTLDLNILNEAAANFKIKSHKNKKKKEGEILEEYFIQKFSINNYELIKDLIIKWEEYKIINEPRMRIIQSCLKVLETQDLEVALDVIIPALVAQIEGIARDLGWKKGNYEKFKKTLSKKLKTDIGSINYMFFVPAETFINEILYGHHPTSSENLNRHNILHGNITDYNSLANLIRFFLTIDVLCCIKIYVKDSSI